MKNLFLLLLVFFLVSFQGKEVEIQNAKSEVEISASDKAFLLDYFQKTRDHLQDVTEDLSPTQLQYKVSEDHWSVIQILEHIVLTENALFGMTKDLMASAPAPERRTEIKSADEDLIKGIEDRSQKFQASAELQPNGKYVDVETALEEFEDQREEMLEFIRKTSEKDMRDHITDSPLGTMDAYQSLLFIAGHTARHTKQIEEVLADPGFPE